MTQTEEAITQIEEMKHIVRKAHNKEEMIYVLRTEVSLTLTRT